MIREEIANLIREYFDEGDRFYTRDLIRKDGSGKYTSQQVGPILRSLNTHHHGVKLSVWKRDRNGVFIWEVDEITESVVNDSIK